MRIHRVAYQNKIQWISRIKNNYLEKTSLQTHIDIKVSKFLCSAKEQYGYIQILGWLSYICLLYQTNRMYKKHRWPKGLGTLTNADGNFYWKVLDADINDLANVISSLCVSSLKEVVRKSSGFPSYLLVTQLQDNGPQIRPEARNDPVWTENEAAPLHVTEGVALRYVQRSPYKITCSARKPFMILCYRRADTAKRYYICKIQRRTKGLSDLTTIKDFQSINPWENYSEISLNYF